jgi:hypothetical protein
MARTCDGACIKRPLHEAISAYASLLWLRENATEAYNRSVSGQAKAKQVLSIS